MSVNRTSVENWEKGQAAREFEVADLKRDVVYLRNAEISGTLAALIQLKIRALKERRDVQV